MNGQISSIIVDDRVLVYKEDTSRLAFCSSSNHAIWAILLEKAWAKVNGSYAMTIAGLSGLAAIHLTGVPNTFVSHRK